MTDTPLQSGSSTGVIRIARQARHRGRVQAFDFLVSFGGSKNPGEALYLGKAFGADDLVNMLTTKIGVPLADAQAAAQALTHKPLYLIPDVTISQAQLYALTK